ncbi:MAG: KilA-N domain-containing protein [Bacteroidota bacterium]
MIQYQYRNNNNLNFKDNECSTLIEMMRSSSFTLTLKQWIAKTGAMGITSKQGKNGGTYAHPDIACEFNIWLNPAFRLDVIKKFRAGSNIDSCS